MTNRSLERWHRLFEARLDRRRLLRGALAAGAASLLPLRLHAGGSGPRGGDFKPVAASTLDELRVPEGFEVDLLAAWQDEIRPGLRFGFNCDWTGFLPLDTLARGPDPSAPHRGFQAPAASSRDGLLAVNHEYPDPVFVGGWDGRSPKSAAQLDAEQECVGLTVLRVRRRRDGSWRAVPDRRTRRVTAATPCRLTGPAAALDGGPMVRGTLANCSGGLTPWGTVLSCEENHQFFPARPFGFQWPAEVYGLRHHGWVVELDPFDPEDVPRKHTALGRMRHENVALRLASDGRVIAYLGDDRAGGCLYKFVSSGRWTERLPRDEARRLLEDGTLHAADMETGRWLALPAEAEALADAHRTARGLGATALDRPEDVEVHPGDGSVFVSLTHANPARDVYGSIIRLQEKDGDPAGRRFEWGVFATGGAESGFAAPDNLAFDERGRLWACSDGMARLAGSKAFPEKVNDALFVFETEGPEAGRCLRFATAPIGAEFAGPSFTPDGRTLFLAVQHPGEGSPSREAPTSRWPRGGSDVPRPSVVAIRDFGGA